MPRNGLAGSHGNSVFSLMSLHTVIYYAVFHHLLSQEKVSSLQLPQFHSFNHVHRLKWMDYLWLPTLEFSSVTQLCPTLCDPMDCSTPGFPVHHQFPELTQTHVHWVGDANQPPPHPPSSPSPPALNLSQHQGLFQWVSFLHQVANVLELQLQHQSFQWIFRTDFL